MGNDNAALYYLAHLPLGHVPGKDIPLAATGLADLWGGTVTKDSADRQQGSEVA
jgi:hypothetical protein